MSSLTIGSSGQIQGSISITSNGTGEDNAQQMLRSLNAGDFINGKVISISTAPDGTRTAQIDLGNNTLVDAKLNNGMELIAGQNITFTIRSTTSGTLSLMPLYENTAAMDATAQKALLAAGLAATDDLKQMVGEMMRNGMGIDRNSLIQMSNILAENPSAEISILVQMKNLNIPITEGNIQQFQNYQNYQHQVADGVNAVMNTIPDVYQELFGGGNKTGALDLYGELMKLFSGNGAEAEKSGVPLMTNSASLKESGRAANAENSVTAKNPVMETPDTAVKQETANVENSTKDALNNISEKTNTILNQMLGNSMQTNSDVVIAQANAQAAGNAENALYIMSRVDISQFAQAMKKLGFSGQVLQMLLEGNVLEDPSVLLKNLSDLYERTAHTSGAVDQAWNKLFSSDTFTNLLKNTIASQWMLQPEDVSEKKNVEDLYERLNEQTKQLTKLLQNTTSEDSGAYQSSRNLSQNMDFMKQINQMYAYVQLPLKMSGNETHGDLYVYSNKKHMASKDGSVSALLHLDMANLGPMDVYVKMTDTKVSTKFYLADESGMDLIETHIDELNAQLNKRGYSMTCKVMMAGEDASADAPVDALLQKNTKMKQVSVSSFDARA